MGPGWEPLGVLSRGRMGSTWVFMGLRGRLDSGGSAGCSPSIHLCFPSSGLPQLETTTSPLVGVLHPSQSSARSEVTSRATGQPGSHANSPGWLHTASSHLDGLPTLQRQRPTQHCDLAQDPDLPRLGSPGCVGTHSPRPASSSEPHFFLTSGWPFLPSQPAAEAPPPRTPP